MGIYIGLFMRTAGVSIVPSQALPMFIRLYFPPILGGIFWAGILITVVGAAAGLSFGIATNLVQDFLKALPYMKMDEKRALFMSRAAVIFIVLSAAYMGELFSGDMILQWSYLSMSLRGAGTFFPFIVALLSPSAFSLLGIMLCWWRLIGSIDSAFIFTNVPRFSFGLLVSASFWLRYLFTEVIFMIGQTKIMKIIDSTEKVIKIIVDPNPFHPAGGGQPGDTGCLRAENFLAHVIDCQKEGEEIVLYIKVKSGTIHENMQVESFVDLERQWLLSRMHSGEHVISKVLENTYPELHIYKVDVGTESTAVYLRYPHELNWEILFKAEEDANEVIKKDLPVTVDVLSPEDAKKMIDLKANWERIGENDLVRVVTIPDFDMIACSGTHVCRTSDIGGVFIEGFNGRAPEWEFRFTVHREEAMRKESYVMRKLLRTIGCPLEKLEEVFKRLQMENKALIKDWIILKNMFPLQSSHGGKSFIP